MTIRHLKIFIEVYKKNNVTHAADALHMTQPAVTRAIKEIENYYGIKLFERINKRLYVTEAGREFYSHAIHIADSFDIMEKRLRNWDELGIIRVGTTITLGNTLLPNVLADFSKTHPDMRVKSTVSNAENLQLALLDNRLDFAVIEGNVDNDQLHKEIISEDRLILILPPNDPRANASTLLLEDLTDSPLLLRENGSIGRSLLNHVFAIHDIPMAPAMESVSTQAIIHAVGKGLGISFLPEALVRPSLEAGIISTRIVDNENFVRNNYVVWHKHKFLTSSTKELIELFRSSI
ncbi:MAG: LysR family transcriptional regulator [Lachnospiraceae bacterium]|nr:LysR family transcriptional regulator [Lachnospiraceae bacterium]